MKKTAMVVAIMLSMSAAAMAQTVAAGRISLEGYGALGTSYPGGTIGSDYSSGFELSYGAGIQAAIGLTDTIQLFGGVEYMKKPLTIEGTAATDNDKIIFNYTFLDICGGMRFFVGSFYADLGLYYGIPLGDVTYDYSDDFGSESDTVDSSLVKKDIGLILGLGYLIAVNEQLSIDLGMRIEGGFTKVYDVNSAFNLKSRNLGLMVGAVYAL